MVRRGGCLLVAVLVVASLTGCGTGETEAKEEEESQRAVAMLERANTHLNRVKGLEYVTEGVQKTRSYHRNKDSHSELSQKIPNRGRIWTGPLPRCCPGREVQIGRDLFRP